jgi:Undecaprenyl-phosphate glucose phosphotransferase
MTVHNAHFEHGAMGNDRAELSGGRFISPVGALRAALQFRKSTFSGSIIGGVVRFAEFFAIVWIGLLIASVYVDDANLAFEIYPTAILAVATIYSAAAATIGSYSLASLRRPIRTIPRLWLVWTAAVALFALALFFLKLGETFSRVWFGIWLVAVAGSLTISRIMLANLVRGWTAEGKLERRAVVVGGGEAAQILIRSLEKERETDIRICGVFDDRGDERSPRLVAGYPKLGTIAELVEFGRIAQLDMLLVTLPITAEARVLELLKRLWVLPVDIRLAAHSSKLKFRPRSYSYVGAVPFLDLLDKPMADWDGVNKRAFDLLFGTIALVALSPLMLAAAMAIKLDSRGPVFFRQKRYGFNNEQINVWKFRSMYVDRTDVNANQLVSKGDPRVTRVGRIIRKLSIDELPQLFNVLAGQLSLVGPRPHALSAKAEDRLYEQVVDGYFARHKVKPGVTGWAQINGWRGETDTSEKIMKRVEHDLDYIENWSLAFDLYILFATPLRLLDTGNAY